MEVLVQHLTHRTLDMLGTLRSIGALRLAVALVGVLGLSVIAAQITPGQTAQAASASWLYFQRDYYLDNGWLCYGWSNGAYHCTHHWHRAANGTLISDNHAWVPNGLNGTSYTTSSAAAVDRAPVHLAPVHPAPAKPAAAPSTGSIANQIRAVFGPYGNQAVAVATCESGLNPNAANPNSTARGLFQFLSSTWATTSYAGYSPFNAWANIQAAHQVFVRDGYSWHEWVCQP